MEDFEEIMRFTFTSHLYQCTKRPFNLKLQKQNQSPTYGQNQGSSLDSSVHPTFMVILPTSSLYMAQLWPSIIAME